MVLRAARLTLGRQQTKAKASQIEAAVGALVVVVADEVGGGRWVSDGRGISHRIRAWGGAVRLDSGQDGMNGAWEGACGGGGGRGDAPDASRRLEMAGGRRPTRWHVGKGQFGLLSCTLEPH
jgi:hypothetical protein